MDKQKLSKLASLNNDNANKFLLNFANAKKSEIKLMSTNEDIIKTLEDLESIFYRVPKAILSICVELLYEHKPISERVIQHDIKGAKWEKVQTKALQVLKQMRYYELKKIVKVAFDFSNHENQDIKNAAIKLIQEISEYDYQALPHVGLKPQIVVLDYIKKTFLKSGEVEVNFAAIKTALEKVLETSAEATILTAPDSITFRKGDLVGSNHLKDLRDSCIDLVFKVYGKVASNLARVGIIHILTQACQLPMSSESSSSIGVIVQENRKRIISKINNILFDKKGVIKAPLFFCMEIEHLLYWQFIFNKQQDDIARPLYDKLTQYPVYEKFSRFVHDDSLRYEIGSQEEETQNRLNVSNYVESIAEKDSENIAQELNSFAVDVDVIGEWKFRNLQALLEKLAQSKPEFAFDLIKDSLKDKKPLSQHMFLAFLLRGIRLSGEYEIWDRSLKFITKLKNPDFIATIPASLHIYADIHNEPVLREQDISVLRDLIGKNIDFAFLKSQKNLNAINHSTINALRAVYHLKPKTIEDLIVAEMKSNPEFVRNNLHVLSLYSGREGGIDFASWSNKNKNFIISKLVETPVIDWHIDNLISNLYTDPVGIIKLFISRMKVESVIERTSDDYLNQYEPIPFDINGNLVQYVVTHKDYIQIIPEIAKASKNRNIGKYDLAKLSNHFNVSAEQLLSALSNNQNEVTDRVLADTLDIIYTFEGIDVDLAVKLASHTDNNKLLQRIAGYLHNTGVVSGQYGTADDYKTKIVLLEKYRNDPGENIRKFVEMSIESLTYLEARARRDADQDKEIRRIDFEMNSQ